MTIIRNRHYAQSSTSAKRRAALAERRATGKAGQPRRAWHKGQGTHAQIVANAARINAAGSAVVARHNVSDDRSQTVGEQR